MDPVQVRNIIITGMIRSGTTFLAGVLDEKLGKHMYVREPGNSENFIKRGSLFGGHLGEKIFDTTYTTKNDDFAQRLVHLTKGLLINPWSLWSWDLLLSPRGLKYSRILLKRSMGRPMILKDPTMPFIALDAAVLSAGKVYFVIRHPHAVIQSILNNYSLLENKELEEGIPTYFHGVEEIMRLLSREVTILKYEDLLDDFNGFLESEFGLVTDYQVVEKSQNSLGWGYKKNVVVKDTSVLTLEQLTAKQSFKLTDCYSVKFWSKYYEDHTLV